MKKFIGLGDMSYYLLYPTFMGVSFPFGRYFIREVVISNKDEANKNLRNCIIFSSCLNILMFLSEITPPILVYILCKSRFNRGTHEHLKKSSKKSSRSVLLLLSLLVFFVLLDCLQGLTIFIFGIANQDFSVILYTKSLSIIAIMIFSSCILKYSFYIHHIIGILLIGIGTIMFITFRCFFCGEQKIGSYFCNDINNFNHKIFIWVLFTCIIYGLEETVEKKLMESFFYSPYDLLFIEGFSGIIISLVVLLICLVVQPSKEFTETNPNHIWIYYIGIYFSLLAYNLFRVLTNHHSSPCHFSIAGSIGIILYWIFFIMTEKKDNNNNNDDIIYIVISLLSFLIIILGVMIFNEIIELLFCNFSENTKRMIKKRVIEEQEEYNQNSLL